VIAEGRTANSKSTLQKQLTNPDQNRSTALIFADAANTFSCWFVESPDIRAFPLLSVIVSRCSRYARNLRRFRVHPRQSAVAIAALDVIQSARPQPDPRCAVAYFVPFTTIMPTGLP